MNLKWKRIISWITVVTGLLGVALSYYAIWVLVAYFAASLVWYANVALLVSGPTAGVGAVIACRKPRQNLALAFGLFGFTFWVLLWVLCFSVLGFRVR